MVTTGIVHPFWLLNQKCIVLCNCSSVQQAMEIPYYCAQNLLCYIGLRLPSSIIIEVSTET